MDDINLNIEKDDFSHYYFRLAYIGKAMFAYYDGEVLTENQIKLIAESSYKEKILGMNLVADIRLRFEEGSNSIYKTNTTAILTASRKLKMNK